MPRPCAISPLTTERLILREPVVADMAAVWAIFGDPATCRHNPVGPLRDEAAAADLLWRWQMHWVQHGFGLWAIADKANPDRVIGFGGLSWRAYGDTQRLNLGFRFAVDAWGKGLATELGEAALQVAFDVLGAEAVHGLVRPDHLASQRVLEKLGMQPDGELQDFPWLPASSLFKLGSETYAASHCQQSKPAGRLLASRQESDQVA
ncbi:GNAT family N-acetyltransferase [Chitinimonas sp. BJYL2]|uniref:GNAT family N-acetyltransferase n=1 Tax=Chitinimonas sp. BJYL2 TaxID=2976696 RepID=UPI0022B37F10|nr:GNAT family N-acetyltransferase [Chitinimonas sp. BJYL2]